VSRRNPLRRTSGRIPTPNGKSCNLYWQVKRGLPVGGFAPALPGAVHRL